MCIYRSYAANRFGAWQRRNAAPDVSSPRRSARRAALTHRHAVPGRQAVPVIAGQVLYPALPAETRYETSCSETAQPETPAPLPGRAENLVGEPGGVAVATSPNEQVKFEGRHSTTVVW